MIYFWIGIGGMIGSLFRFLLTFITAQVWMNVFPLGTLLINLSGAFFLGWFTSKYVYPVKFHPYFRTAITTGIIGSYTTFSTFCLESVQLLQQRDYATGVFYILASLFGGLIFVKLGVKMGEQSLQKEENVR